jgi:hypothetical protein
VSSRQWICDIYVPVHIYLVKIESGT